MFSHSLQNSHKQEFPQPLTNNHQPTTKKSKHGNYIKEHGNSIKQVKYRIFILQGLKIHLSKD